MLSGLRGWVLVSPEAPAGVRGSALSSPRGGPRARRRCSPRVGRPPLRGLEGLPAGWPGAARKLRAQAPAKETGEEGAGGERRARAPEGQQGKSAQQGEREP